LNLINEKWAISWLKNDMAPPNKPTLLKKKEKKKKKKRANPR